MSDLDPYRAVDRQPDPRKYAALLESRGRTKSQTRLRRRFLSFAGIKRGWKVLEVGTGTGVVARDLASRVGPRGRAVGIDPSVVLIREARRLARGNGLGRRLRFEVGEGHSLHVREGTFDAALAVTVLLHVPDPEQVLGEMIRVTRPGGLIGAQDQDFGSLVLDHPDRRLTQTIFDTYAWKIYDDPWSGRTLFGKFKSLGLRKVRMTTEIYQDTTLEPFTRSLLERRVEMAEQWNVISSSEKARWLDALDAQVRAGTFLMTLNFYGVVGTKPLASKRR